MPPTLFIVNPHAGRVRKLWRDLQLRLDEWVTDYYTVMTHTQEDVVDCLAQAATDGVDRVITVGGDGTNNYLVNALMQHRRDHPQHRLIFGTIPAGTGRDFARGAGLPLESYEAAEYVLTQASVRSIDVGEIIVGGVSSYFLNASNVGIANDVVQRVERSAKRPWSYLLSVVASLRLYQPELVRIELDGELWCEERVYVVAVANGTTIGQGILIAPHARIDDGLFDVIIAREMPMLELIVAFPSIYTGKHIDHPKVKVGRAKHVRITSPLDKTIGMDIDGEPATGASDMTYQLHPAAIKMLL